MRYFGSPEHLEECRVARLRRAQRVWRAASAGHGRVLKVRELMRATGMSTDAVRQALGDLHELGYVGRRPVGRGDKTIWLLRVPLMEVGS